MVYTNKPVNDINVQLHRVKYSHMSEIEQQPVGIGYFSTNQKQWLRADSRFAPSQWETALLCNHVSHWLGASVESALWPITTTCYAGWQYTVEFLSKLCDHVWYVRQ